MPVKKVPPKMMSTNSVNNNNLVRLNSHVFLAPRTPVFKHDPDIGFICIFYAKQPSPLYLWDKYQGGGKIQRVLEFGNASLHLEGTSFQSTRLATPVRPFTTLGIKLPFMVVILKNLNRWIGFDVQIEDSQKCRRRFQFSSKIVAGKRRPGSCTVPINLYQDWNELTIDLQLYTKRIYGTDYVETIRVQVYPNCHLRHIYFTERLMTLQKSLGIMKILLQEGTDAFDVRRVNEAGVLIDPPPKNSKKFVFKKKTKKHRNNKHIEEESFTNSLPALTEGNENQEAGTTLDKPPVEITVIKKVKKRKTKAQSLPKIIEETDSVEIPDEEMTNENLISYADYLLMQGQIQLLNPLTGETEILVITPEGEIDLTDQNVNNIKYEENSSTENSSTANSSTEGSSKGSPKLCSGSRHLSKEVVVELPKRLTEYLKESTAMQKLNKEEEMDSADQTEVENETMFDENLLQVVPVNSQGFESYILFDESEFYTLAEVEDEGTEPEKELLSPVSNVITKKKKTLNGTQQMTKVDTGKCLVDDDDEGITKPSPANKNGENKNVDSNSNGTKNVASQTRRILKKRNSKSQTKEDDSKQ